MKNTMKASALLLAGMLALTACGGSEEPASASDKDAASSESASPTPTLAVGQEQYTAAELVAALEAVNTAQGGAGAVSDDAAFREYLGQQSLPEGVKITPEKCADFAGFTDFFGDLDEANIAYLALGTDQKLALISHPEAATLDTVMQENKALMDECGSFEMGAEGLTVAGTAETLKVTTEAPLTQAFALSLSAEGNTLSGLKVSAASGTTNVVLINSDAANKDEATAEATKLIDAVLAELKK